MKAAFNLKKRWLAPAVALLGLHGNAFADTCRAPQGALEALENIDPAERLNWIDTHLSRTARRAQVWVWGWEIGLGIGTAANLAPIPFVGHELRIDFYTGAVTTIVGLVPLVLMPPTVIKDSRQLRDSIATGLPTSSTCIVLADAERRLARDADDQAFAQAWWVHAGNVLLNGGVGLFLGLGYHHWIAGTLNFVSGAAIGEIIILTQPHETIGDLQRYRRANLSDPQGITWSALPILGDDRAGMQLSLSF